MRMTVAEFVWIYSDGVVTHFERRLIRQTTFSRPRLST